MDRQGVWRAACWGIASTCVFDGLSYMILGNSVTAGPSFSLLSEAPGGMRTYGTIMFVLGVALFVTAHRRSLMTGRILFSVFVFGDVISVFIVAGWIHVHHFSPGSISKWFLIEWLALWLVFTRLDRKPNVATRRS